MIYFDSAATTLQKPAAVTRAMAAAAGSATTPGRGDHPWARRAAEILLRLRTEAAELFGVSEPDRVILTMNATHALNIAVKSLVRPGDTVVVSGYEHNAVTRPLRAVGAVDVRVVNARLFDRKQMVEGFRRALDGGAEAAVCTHMSNVFGYELPVDDIAALCRARGVPLIVDASQSAGRLEVDLRRWGAAYVAMPGHKGLYGPQGTGLLLCGEDASPRTLLEGGTGSLSMDQEMPAFLPDRLEAGTQNVQGAAGLLEGIRFVRRLGLPYIRRRESAVMGLLADGLRRKGTFRVFCDGPEAPPVLSVVPLRAGAEALAESLARRGVAVRAGLHCAPLAHRTAGTAKTGTVRFSASVFNTAAEAREVLEML